MSTPYIDISSGSFYSYSSSYSAPGGSHKLLTYYSLNQLYYSLFDKQSGTIVESGSFDNFIESSFTSQSRYLNNSGVVYSIPKQLYGTHLEPNSISVGSLASYLLIDDGEGNLIISSSGMHVGNVVYTHGQIIITDPTVSATFLASPAQDLSFRSNVPIYTKTYTVRVSDYEYNHTLNPTAQTGVTTLEYSGSTYTIPSGKYADNVTGSAFQPYITTVGLFNDSNELIAVGKLSQPLPKPANTELTIQVKLDV